MERNQGHIVTVGSVAGLLGTYGCTDYSATKFACVGFHEALFTELKVSHNSFERQICNEKLLICLSTEFLFTFLIL